MVGICGDSEGLPVTWYNAAILESTSFFRASAS